MNLLSQLKSLYNKDKKSQQATTQQDKLLREQGLILSQRASFHVKEAYKAARTNIMFSLPGKGCKRIVITSPFLGEGKSTTCLNLAITFAQTGSKVLVIDADLRKPTVHRKLNMPNERGLAHLLGHFSKIKETIQTSKYENLDVITAGHTPPNPAELLASDMMKELLDELSESYDYIFLDTPPLNIVTDATVLSNVVSGMVVIVRQGRTQYKEVQDALEKLTFTENKVLGFILHGIQYQNTGYGKYRSYSRYGYKRYGYSRYGYSRYGYSRYGYTAYTEESNNTK